MEERFRKFKSTQQPAVKLSIAAEDFFLPQVEKSYKDAYGAYLQQRIRPAVELLIREEKTECLQKLAELQWFPDAFLEDFLRYAMEHHKNAAFVWLLQRKQETKGFPAGDFSL